MSLPLFSPRILPLSSFLQNHPDRLPVRPQVRVEYCPFCKEKQSHTLLEEIASPGHLPGQAGFLLQCNTCQACSLH
jgi:hypothetical protein